MQPGISELPNLCVGDQGGSCVLTHVSNGGAACVCVKLTAVLREAAWRLDGVLKAELFMFTEDVAA